MGQRVTGDTGSPRRRDLGPSPRRWVRARVTQIMNLLHLTPDIQEDILFLPKAETGRDPIAESDVRRICAAMAWRTQRILWITAKTIAERQPQSLLSGQMSNRCNWL